MLFDYEQRSLTKNLKLRDLHFSARNFGSIPNTSKIKGARYVRNSNEGKQRMSQQEDLGIQAFCFCVGKLSTKWNTKHFIEGEPIYRETLIDTLKAFTKNAKLDC